jgi:hypothetical protein
VDAKPLIERRGEMWQVTMVSGDSTHRFALTQHAMTALVEHGKIRLGEVYARDTIVELFMAPIGPAAKNASRRRRAT